MSVFFLNIHFVDINFLFICSVTFFLDTGFHTLLDIKLVISFLMASIHNSFSGPNNVSLIVLVLLDLMILSNSHVLNRLDCNKYLVSGVLFVLLT
jgi:hypothetical protein